MERSSLIRRFQQVVGYSEMPFLEAEHGEVIECGRFGSVSNEEPGHVAEVPWAMPAGSMTYIKRSEANTTSKAPSSAGYRFGAPFTDLHILLTQVDHRRFASISISGLMSTAVTLPPGRNRGAAAVATAAVPVPRSRTTAECTKHGGGSLTPLR